MNRNQSGLLAALVLSLIAGCKSSQKYDLIEAELRAKDRELAAAQAELEYLRGMGRAIQSSRRIGDVPMVPIKEIAIASGTGGAETDGQPGDDALEVIVVPKDSDGSSLKVPGKVTVFASEISSSGVKTPIGRWDVAPEALRKFWHSHLLSTGYVLLLQWDRLPSTEKLRVTVQFTTLDGQLYESDKDVTVRPKCQAAEDRPAVRISRVIVNE